MTDYKLLRRRTEWRYGGATITVDEGSVRFVARL